jgi:pimeloyl-ACP methyl ester carboxylesterase
MVTPAPNVSSVTRGEKQVTITHTVFGALYCHDQEAETMAFLKGSPGHSGRRVPRIVKILGIVALALVALVLVLAAVNLILTDREQSTFDPYGRRVPVEGGSVNVWRNGHSGPTMVLLSGLGTAAPALDFAPLIRQLGAYDVIVVEGFGYGYADMSGPPRTVQNITAELHDVLSKVGAPRPYILVGHSIAGFYTLAYAHRYPDEVSAVVGIDATVPAAEAGSAGTSGLPFHALGTVLRTIGVVRAAITLAPGLAEPNGSAYTADQRARIRAMTIWNFGNAAVADETDRMGSNAEALQGVTYPDRLPVLALLSTDSVAMTPDWLATHEDQLSNVRHHEVVVLNGGHYLHWTQSKAMADKITTFLRANLARAQERMDGFNVTVPDAAWERFGQAKDAAW